MRIFLKLCIATMSLITIPGCTADHIEEARTGVRALLNEQLAIADVNQVAWHDSSFTSNIDSSCSFGRIQVLVGSTLPAPEAFKRYTSELKLLGWRSTGLQYADAATLSKGDRAFIAVDYGGDGGESLELGPSSRLYSSNTEIYYCNVCSA